MHHRCLSLVALLAFVPVALASCESDTSGDRSESETARTVHTSGQALDPAEGGGKGGPPGSSEASDESTESKGGKRADRASDDETSRDEIDAGDVPPVGSKVERSDKEWKKRLTPAEYHILREKGTERPGSGDLLDNKQKGIYYCAACGAPLFSSRHKYDSNTGWPSFYKPYEPGRVGEKVDKSLSMKRIEVVCDRCGSHLGHVFDDGPPPTGKRYCINSKVLDFKSVDEIQSDDD